ncbi:MAG TPA: oxidoreductase, partial [Stenotrophomonas sp.]|nr:oxidoreductase [Stenotrophomonas sp.]
YLLHQFLSPLSNRRTDGYGGSLPNRLRLLVEVFDAVRAAVSDKVSVGVRISATDWVDGGWDLVQSEALAQILDARGCNFLHVSSGGLDERQKISVGPGYQVPFAAAIKAKKLRMPVIAVGLITEPEQAESILRHNQADAIALARGILYDPRWPWHAAAALGDSVVPSPQYLRCEPREARNVFRPR